MNCEQIFELICGHIDGQNTPEQEQCLQEHLSQCEQCRKTLEAWGGIDQNVRQLRAEPPEGLKQGVMYRISQAAAPRKKRWWLFGPGTAIGAAAAILLLLVSTGVIAQPRLDRDIVTKQEAATAAAAEMDDAAQESDAALPPELGVVLEDQSPDAAEPEETAVLQAPQQIEAAADESYAYGQNPSTGATAQTEPPEQPEEETPDTAPMDAAAETTASADSTPGNGAPDEPAPDETASSDSVSSKRTLRKRAPSAPAPSNGLSQTDRNFCAELAQQNGVPVLAYLWLDADFPAQLTALCPALGAALSEAEVQQDGDRTILTTSFETAMAVQEWLMLQLPTPANEAEQAQAEALAAWLDTLDPDYAYLSAYVDPASVTQTTDWPQSWPADWTSQLRAQQNWCLCLAPDTPPQADGTAMLVLLHSAQP